MYIIKVKFITNIHDNAYLEHSLCVSYIEPPSIPYSHSNKTSYIDDKVASPLNNSLETHRDKLTKMLPKNYIPSGLCYLCRRHTNVADFIKASNLTEHYEGKHSLE